VPCRLYLVTPPDLTSGGVDPAAFAKDFAKALKAGDVAAVLLPASDGDETVVRAAIEALCPIAQAADAAFVVEGRADLAVEFGCDGVQVPASPGTLRSVRRALGDDMIVGADCGDSRHLGMVAGEMDVDYVCFDAAATDVLAWWAELMEVPCVAYGGVTLDNAPALIEAGVDFLAVGDAVWTASTGPAAAVKAFDKLIADAEA
jgi:thiamine-phosphate pyrophosphorylase